MTDANDEQRALWNERMGPIWVENQERLDAQIRAHGALSIGRLDPQPGERILDVGCGCGETSLELARRVGPSGEVIGVDVSAPMLARARERAEAEGLAVRFVEADAQTAELPRAVDGIHSRFGVMFFDDPVRAFANLRAALRPGGRLAFVCWQGPPANPWVVVPMSAIAPLFEMPPPPPPDAPGMFAFADGDRVGQILTDAGFADVEVVPEQLDMTLGDGDSASAARLFLEVGPAAALLREQDPTGALRGQAVEALEKALDAHLVDGAPVLGSGIWRVSATRPEAG